MTTFEHTTVLLEATVALVIDETPLNETGNQSRFIWVDCTLGGAGHTLLLLQRLANKLRLAAHQNAPIVEHICCDQDPLALRAAGERISKWLESQTDLNNRLIVTLLPINFRELPRWVELNRPDCKVQGLIADLGVSSPQIDSAERGFSFLREGPLDMRMNTNATTTAKELLLSLSANELSQIFSEYGEEPRARPLARAIVDDRSTGRLPLSNTVEFANYVARVLGYHQSRVHPATRIFQALRIAVNEELSSVEHLLRELPQIMAHGGSAALISFHSLEDRLVKRFIRAWEQGELSPEAKLERERRQWRESEAGIWGAGNFAEETLGEETPRGGIVADADEVSRNPRARSARLRGFRFKLKI